MDPDVLSGSSLPQYRLLLEFMNGERKIFDVSPYLSLGVFQRLKDPAVFSAVRVAYGSVEWPGEIDLSYDTVYLEGVPVDDLAFRTVA